MGVLKSILLVFVCVLLFISLFLTGTYATLNNSLDYDVLEPKVKPLIKESFLGEEDIKEIEQNQEELEKYCGENNTEYFFEEEDLNYSSKIPCEVILNGSEAVIDYQAKNFFQEIYYKNYTCDFWNCFNEDSGQMFLISEYSKNHWKSNYYLFLIISIVLGVLTFFLVSNKSNFPILTGLLLVGSFFPVSLLDSVGEGILNAIFFASQHAIEGFSSIDIGMFVSLFFSQANNVFFTGLVIGLILICVGILWKLIKVGFKIEHLFKKKNKKETPEKEEL